MADLRDQKAPRMSHLLSTSTAPHHMLWTREGCDCFQNFGMRMKRIRDSRKHRPCSKSIGRSACS